MLGRDVLADDDELVPTEPRDGVHFTHDVANAPCAFLQQRVAGGVPQRVIDAFEPVEIQEQYGDLVPVAASALQRAVNLLHDGRPVEQSGQRVMVGPPHQLGLSVFAFGDVLDG